MTILATLLSVFTGPRYAPDFQWSSNSWTHNIFRFYELVFGRGFGIRHEMSASARKDKRGHLIVTYTCHSFESVVALLEQKVRGLMPHWKPIRIWIPKLATAGLFLPGLESPFLFAVALDTSNKSTANNSGFSFSYTCTGSNRILMANCGRGNAETLSGLTYNSVGTTNINSISSAPYGIDFQYLLAPATGSNSLAGSWSASGGHSIEASSFSGVKQSGQPSATNTTGSFATGSSPLSQSVTTVDDNSWIVWGFLVSGSASSGTNCTIRQQEVVFAGTGIADTNAAQTPTGSKTMTVTWGGSLVNGGILAAISPVVAINYTLTAGTGVFVLTGIAALFHQVLHLITTVATFTLTGVSATLSKFTSITLDSRHSGGFTQNNRSSSPTFTQDSRNSSTFTPDNRH